MIEVEELTKRYGRRTVVDELSFTVRPGRVTGFLGPNGAGKTQTIKMILGLVHPTGGRVRVDGIAGAVLDGGAFHRGRTARAALRIYARLAGAPPSSADELLERVGLTDAATRRVGTFSLGMRQRLALAQGLIADPAVLIADEPANGLDPAGIVWLRELLRGLAAEGRTVLVSSHLLAEAERLVDESIVIVDGRTVGVLDASADLEARYLALTA